MCITSKGTLLYNFASIVILFFNRSVNTHTTVSGVHLFQTSSCVSKLVLFYVVLITTIVVLKGFTKSAEVDWL